MHLRGSNDLHSVVVVIFAIMMENYVIPAKYDNEGWEGYESQILLP